MADRCSDRNKTGSLRTSWRVLLSAFVVFHLASVLIAPNTQTYLGMKMAPWVEPYISFFELTNTWSFFAPDPGPPPVYIEWEALNSSGALIKNGSFPEISSPFALRERQNRRIAAMEFMLASEERLKKMLIPYLCRETPGAHSIRLWSKVDVIPSLAEVAEGKRTLSDERGVERKAIARAFCEDLTL